MATITINLLDTKRTVLSKNNQVYLSAPNSDYLMVAGENNATDFAVLYNAIYDEYVFTVTMVNSKGEGIQFELVDNAFALEMNMTVAGYTKIFITATNGESTIAWERIDIKISSTSPDYVALTENSIEFVRYNQQTLTEAQQTQVRNNINAASKDDIRVEKYAFETYANFIDWIAGTFERTDGVLPTDLLIGDKILLVETSKPDYWLKSISTPITIEDFTPIETDLSNYLAKDNTIEYTPTEDYHPATKEYVDNKSLDTDSVVAIIKAYPTDLSNTVQLGVSNVNEYAEYTGGQMTPTLAETLYGVDPDTKVFCTKSNAIFKNGSVYGIIELSEVGRPTTYSFIETESPTIPTDTTKEYSLVPTGENDTFRLSESSNFVSSYIVGATPLASDWLSLEDSGSALTPVTNKIYIIKTAGDYYNKQYTWNGTVFELISSDNIQDTWSAKTWSGLTSFLGNFIWTDGINYYYSYGTLQYVLNKETSTWSEKTWTGLTSFFGQEIWTDGINYYYSYSTAQYVLNKETSTWSEKIWTGLTNFGGIYIWTDGVDYYYSYETLQYVLNKETSTWSTKTWSGLTSFNGSRIWTDGINYYYSNGNTQYVLNKETSTWSAKTWSGLTSFLGDFIWTDGINYYYSNGNTQYVLNKDTSTWSVKTWTGLTSFNGSSIWTDEANYYYSFDTTQYVLLLPFVTLNGTETLTNKTLTDPVIQRIKNGDYYLSTPTLIQNETIATLNDIQSAATNHANLSNLDYASSGHTGFIGGNTQYGGTISDNLDTITKSGFYTCYSTATGVPNSTYSWFVLHENSNVGVISAKQTATAYNGVIMTYERVKTSSTWGDWVKITTAQDTKTYTTTLPTTSGGTSDWQAVTGGYELAKTISGLTAYDSIVTVADDDTIWTDNELNATITTDTLTFFVSSLPSAEVTLTLTITKSTNGGTI